MRLLVALVVAVIGLGLTPVQAGEAEFSVTGKPVWFEVSGSEGPCVVNALATREPMGELQGGYRFLSFGVTSKWVTLAYNGRIAFVPVGSVTEMFPHQAAEPQWRGYGPTLEEQLKAQQARADEARKEGKPLAPFFTNQPTATPAANTSFGGVRDGMVPDRAAGKGYI
jgi:hypothetical protein